MFDLSGVRMNNLDLCSYVTSAARWNINYLKKRGVKITKSTLPNHVRAKRLNFWGVNPCMEGRLKLENLSIVSLDDAYEWLFNRQWFGNILERVNNLEDLLNSC